jgi:hypothetical protein
MTKNTASGLQSLNAFSVATSMFYDNSKTCAVPYIINAFYCSVYLSCAALYKLIFILQQDTLPRYLGP